jgi:hypothetical protein
MTAFVDGAWDDEDDPLDRYITQAQNNGWSMVPQVGHGTCDNALMRSAEGFTDLLTIPLIGYSTVVRLQGGPESGHPRRTGHQWWRHHVAPQIAVEWALSNPIDDHMLTAWDLTQNAARDDL